MVGGSGSKLDWVRADARPEKRGCCAGAVRHLLLLLLLEAEESWLSVS